MALDKVAQNIRCASAARELKPTTKRRRKQTKQWLKRQFRDLPDGACVETLGTLVSPSMPWLAASPDGVVLDGEGGKPLRLLEVKSYRLEMSARSPVWAQVQGSMAIASDAYGEPVHKCIVATKDETSTLRFDQEWWNRYVRKLRLFYFKTFLPMAAEQVLERAGNME